MRAGISVAAPGPILRRERGRVVGKEAAESSHVI